MVWKFFRYQVVDYNNELKITATVVLLPPTSIISIKTHCVWIIYLISQSHSNEKKNEL